MRICSIVLFALLIFAIPIEHKYDKPTRFFSQSLIPEGLHPPKWFDTKLYFYPSDLIAPLLVILLALPIRELFLRPMNASLWAMLALAVLSIIGSPFWNYPLIYLRVWQWLTGVLFFILASRLDQRAVRIILSTLIAAGVLQSLLAIAQYFHQSSFGLRILGEPSFNRIMANISSFHVPGGYRWIFDRWTGAICDTTIIARVMGTTAHPNVLGGFLSLTHLASLDFFVQSKRKWLWILLLFVQLLALILTFSRAALFALGLGSVIWLIMHKKSSYLYVGLYFIVSSALIGFLFQEQLFHRGGIVNYNEAATSAVNYRLELQTLALQMIKAHPWLGVGFQQFSTQAYRFLHCSPEQHVMGTHNIYLIIAAEMGLVALCCFLFFIVNVLRTALRARHFSFAPSLTGMFIALLFIGCCDFYPILFQMGRLLFFTTAGLLASHATLDNIHK